MYAVLFSYITLHRITLHCVALHYIHCIPVDRQIDTQIDRSVRYINLSIVRVLLKSSRSGQAARSLAFEMCQHGRTRGPQMLWCDGSSPVNRQCPQVSLSNPNLRKCSTATRQWEHAWSSPPEQTRWLSPSHHTWSGRRVCAGALAEHINHGGKGRKLNSTMQLSGRRQPVSSPKGSAHCLNLNLGSPRSIRAIAEVTALPYNAESI